MLTQHCENYADCVKELMLANYQLDDFNNWVKDDEFIALIVQNKENDWKVVYSDFASLNYATSEHYEKGE